jgi:hypothetical protein
MLNVDNAIALYLITFLVIMLVICAVGWFKNYKGVVEDAVVIPPAPPEDE